MQRNNASKYLPPPDEAVLVVDKISKSYDKQKIFSEFSAEFENNGLYIITGPSGCGKTTLLRIVAGLDTDFEGAIYGGGIGKCAVAFQEYRLFPAISAFENVYTATRGTESERTKKAMDSLLSVGFDSEDFEKLPSELSGGMKQRVSLARAIASDKPIILLDEPTKELDSALRERIYEELKKLSKSKLIIMITHLSEDIEKLSDKVIVLEKHRTEK